MAFGNHLCSSMKLIKLAVDFVKNFQKNSTKSSLKFPDRFDLAHLIKMWKRLKKPFNGKFFIKFLRKNPPGEEKEEYDERKKLESERF